MSVNTRIQYVGAQPLGMGDGKNEIETDYVIFGLYVYFRRKNTRGFHSLYAIEDRGLC